MMHGGFMREDARGSSHQASPDVHYYRARAEDELAAAQGAKHPEAVKAHYLLAGFYLDLAHNAEAAAA